jgi:hypothetical protein
MSPPHVPPSQRGPVSGDRSTRRHSLLHGQLTFPDGSDSKHEGHPHPAFGLENPRADGPALTAHPRSTIPLPA